MKYRSAQISPAWEDKLFRLMAAALQELGHDPIIINGVADHIHLLWRHHKTKSMAETMKLVKGRSSRWINVNNLTPIHFRWQPGYGIFSVSKNRVPTIRRYIKRQKVHHGQRTFHQEYAKFLALNDITDLDEYQFSPLI